MTVRPATRHDLEDCVRLWRCLQDEHEAVDRRLRRSLSAESRWRHDFHVWVRSDAHGVFVADDGTAIVGLATVHPYWPAPVYEERLEVHVNELVVSPDVRGQGIGRRLVEAVLDWAREQGAAQVRAGVLASNPAALEFWERAGAKPFYTTVTMEV